MGEEMDSFEVIYNPNKIDNEKVAKCDEKMIIEDKKEETPEKEEELADKQVNDVSMVSQVQEENEAANMEEEPTKEAKEPEPEKEEPKGEKARAVEFLTNVGAETLNNLLAVVYSLLENGNDFEAAVLGGLGAT